MYWLGTRTSSVQTVSPYVLLYRSRGQRGCFTGLAPSPCHGHSGRSWGEWGCLMARAMVMWSSFSHQELVTQPRRIARRYLGGWFWVDLPASIPVDLLCVTTHMSKRHTYTTPCAAIFVHIDTRSTRYRASPSSPCMGWWP